MKHIHLFGIFLPMMILSKGWCALPDFDLLGVEAPGVQTQATTPLEFPQEPPIRVNVNLVQIDVTVRNRSGGILPNLQKQDFIIEEKDSHGKWRQEQIAELSQDVKPLAVVLMVDGSGPSQEERRQLRVAAQETLKLFNKEDKVALLTIDHPWHTFQERLTDDKEKIAQKLSRWEGSGGMTNDVESLREAAEYLEKETPRNTRRIILMIGDNYNGLGQNADTDATLKALQRAGVTIYSVQVQAILCGNSWRDTNQHHVNHQRKCIWQIVSETGGLVFDVSLGNTLFGSLQYAIDLLKSSYVLGYYPANSNMNGEFREIRVRLRPELKDSVVKARKGYYADP